MLQIISVLLLILFVDGCATIPEALRGDYPASLTPTLVREQPKAHIGQAVRWGGIVLGVHNYRDNSSLEILAYPLDDTARPETDEASQGRFLLEMKGFIEPATYEARREVSIIGRIKSVETHKVGDYDYHYPVVEGRVLHLWPKRPLVRPDNYDPWYPWGTWGPYPWYGPYPYHP